MIIVRLNDFLSQRKNKTIWTTITIVLPQSALMENMIISLTNKASTMTCSVVKQAGSVLYNRSTAFLSCSKEV